MFRRLIGGGSKARGLVAWMEYRYITSLVQGSTPGNGTQVFQHEVIRMDEGRNGWGSDVSD